MASISMMDTAEVNMTRVTLERLRKYASKRVGASLADSMEIHRQVDIALEGLVYTLTASVLASKLADDKYTAHFYYKVPATWFQHLKKAHAPKWFKNRYPVRYEDKKATKTVHFKRYETYPKANLALPKDQRTIEMLGYERPLLDTVEEY